MNNITIYTAKNCPYSKRLRDFLYDEEILFEEVKVNDGQSKTQLLYTLDIELRTPIISIKRNNQILRQLIGWNDQSKHALQDCISGSR